MLLWLSFALISAVVLAALLMPLLRPAEVVAEPSAADRAVYADQLAEIAADRARGLIGSSEAEAAEREIARRLLAEDDRPKTPAAAVATGGLPTVLVGLIAILPAAALAIYAALGSPSLPSRPYLARAAAPVERSSVDELIARVEARLVEHPGDGQGWDVIAPVYLRQQRYREAAEAYANALRLLGPNLKRLAGFAEATIIAGNGIVSEEARAAYEEVLKLEPGRPEARFWLAMAKEQDGKLQDAAADYRRLIADAPPDAPWRPAVAERLAAVQARLGPPPPPADDKSRGEAPGTEAAEALRQLPAAEQAKAIEGMVEGLAARLGKDGSDLTGWLRLVRAYKVMGRDEAAVAALARARQAMAGNGNALAELEQLARTLGIGG